jgi:hypothetical protein
MLRKLFWLPALGALMTLLPTTTVRAQEYLDAGSWLLTLSGTGSSNQDINAGSFGVQAELGYLAADQLELFVRQSVSYADFNAGTTTAASTAVGLDYHFDLDRWQPFLGVSVGYQYGDVHNTWYAGPEGGVKYFVKPDTFIYGLVQYQWFFDNGGDAVSNFEDGSFLYGLGIGFTW